MAITAKAMAVIGILLPLVGLVGPTSEAASKSKSKSKSETVIGDEILGGASPPPLTQKLLMSCSTEKGRRCGR